MTFCLRYTGFHVDSLQKIIELIETDLSEPYSIYTYHYFLSEYPHLCRTAWIGNEIVGVIIGRLSRHYPSTKHLKLNELNENNIANSRGYIGMLVVKTEYRSKGIGFTLIKQILELMKADMVDEIVLETEVSNIGAIKLYERLGFIRQKRLLNYYLNGSDAFRLKLWFTNNK